MQYNTSRKSLVLPEYGRSIQKLVDFLKEIESKEERNKAAKALIKLMAQVNPQIKYADDVDHKLWDHLFIMADFDLDIDAPYPPPNKEELMERPKPLKYPSNHIKVRHYGRIVQDMINKATEYEDGEEKETLIMLIANLMKRDYLKWNRDTVTDEVIWSNLEDLSGGKLKRLDVPLAETQEILRSTRKKRTNRQKNKKK